MIEEWLVSNLWWIVVLSLAIILVKIILSHIYKRGQLAMKQYKESQKGVVKGSEDIEMWVNNPEHAIEALRTKRIVCEKEHRTKEIESIDQQIKYLEYLTKIPPVIRPFSSKIINLGLVKAEKWIGGL